MTQYATTLDEVLALRSENTELRKAIADIQRATVEGRVCDDVAWFDTITTLYDFCDLVLHGPNAVEQSQSPCDKEA